MRIKELPWSEDKITEEVPSEVIEITDWLSQKEGIDKIIEVKVIDESDDGLKVKTPKWTDWVPKSQVKERRLEEPDLIKISEIGREDVHVKLRGEITDINNTSMKLDDGTGEVKIYPDNKVPDYMEVDNKIEVWGTPMEVEDIMEFYSDRIIDIPELVGGD